MTHGPELESNPSSPETKKLTRKQIRQQKLQQNALSITETTTISLSITPQMASRSLLVCSLGNPAPLTNTLHSVGHLVLSNLASTLSYPPFQKSRTHGNGLLSAGSDYTLWQSSSFMNISGVGVAAAWRQFVKDNGDGAALVIVHDELELKAGDVKVKNGSASTKGHNGLKSVNERLRGVEYMRVAVGIGRPESRDPGAVADYVLRKIGPGERAKILGAVGRVEEELRRLR